MFDSIWRADSPRDVFDNVALGLIIIFALAGALLALGGASAHFIVSSAYAQAALVPAIVVALIGVLLAVYLRSIGLTTARDPHGIGIMILFGIIGYFAVSVGLPATLASLSNTRDTLTFTVTGPAYGGRSSCWGVYVEREGFERSRVCYIRAVTGASVDVTGRISWYGILYSASSLRS